MRKCAICENMVEVKLTPDDTLVQCEACISLDEYAELAEDENIPGTEVVITFSKLGRLPENTYYLRLLKNGTIEGCKNDSPFAVQGSLNKTFDEWKTKMRENGWREA